MFEQQQTATRSRLAAIASLLVAVAAGVGALYVWNSFNARQGVVVAATDLAPGTILKESDLVVVESDGLANTFVDPQPLVGRVLQFPLESQDVVQVSDIGSDQPITEGKQVIGVLATPGMYPTPDITTGDIVDVLSTESNIVAKESTSGSSGRSNALATNARVFDIVRPEFGATTDLLISIEVDAAEAESIALASQVPGGIRFALKASADGS